MSRSTMEFGNDTAVRDERMPRGLKLAVAVGLAALVGGALLLTAVRCPAILIDLAGGVKAFFCL